MKNQDQKVEGVGVWLLTICNFHKEATKFSPMQF